MPAEPDAPTAGVEREVRRLLDALAAFTRAAPPNPGPAPRAGAPAEGAGEDDPSRQGDPAAHHPGGAPCTSCPVCSGLRAVRDVGPDVLETVADLLSLGAGLARRAAEHVRDEPAAAETTPEHVSHAPTAAPSPAPKDMP